MEETSYMRRSAIKPIEKVNIVSHRQLERFCNCDDCYKSIYKHDCDQLFVCEKCNTKLCKECYIKFDSCVNCAGRLTVFLKKDEVKNPNNMSQFIAIKRKKPWYCLFLC